MTRVEQHKMIQDLRGFQTKMSRDDKTEFDMLLKRDKDDEDLDTLSVRKLEELHARYAKRSSKEDIEAKWKKLTGGT
ncbi:MAG: hypothetical protein L0Y80_04600 [Ignavibacteriae bacterium]|nr:hypothetical protein [Ignavibacteriota bacterium]